MIRLRDGVPFFISYQTGKDCEIIASQPVMSGQAFLSRTHQHRPSS